MNEHLRGGYLVGRGCKPIPGVCSAGIATLNSVHW